MMSLPTEKLKGLVFSIFRTHREEIGCDECFEQVDLFAELVLAGKDAAKVMPHVYQHLAICKACREEFEMLLASLRVV